MGVPSVRSAGQVPGDTPWARARVFGQSGGSLVGSVWRGRGRSSRSSFRRPSRVHVTDSGHRFTASMSHLTRTTSQCGLAGRKNRRSHSRWQPSRGALRADSRSGLTIFQGCCCYAMDRTPQINVPKFPPATWTPRTEASGEAGPADARVRGPRPTPTAQRGPRGPRVGAADALCSKGAEPSCVAPVPEVLNPQTPRSGRGPRVVTELRPDSGGRAVPGGAGERGKAASGQKRVGRRCPWELRVRVC